MLNISIIRRFAPIRVLSSIFTILNSVSFSFYALIYIFFILFNASFFVSSTIQAESLKWSIVMLSLFSLTTILFASLTSPKSLKADLFSSKGFLSVFAFLGSFYVFGLLFLSYEGRVDETFITGFLTNPSFLFTYMFVVAFMEELIFRVGIINLLKSKSKNLFAVYFVSSSIFALYHYYKYSSELSLVFFAFIAGLLFTWLKEKQTFGSLPSFPVAVALHLVYNLFAVGGLSIVFSII